MTLGAQHFALCSTEIVRCGFVVAVDTSKALGFACNVYRGRFLLHGYFGQSEM